MIPKKSSYKVKIKGFSQNLLIKHKKDCPHNSPFSI